MDKIGQRIYVMRTSRGLNQIDLAKMAGVSRSTISMWETGNRKPGYQELEALADAFNVPVSALITDESKSQENDEVAMIRSSIRNNPDIKDILRMADMLSAKSIKQLKAITKALLEVENNIESEYLPKNVTAHQSQHHLIPHIGTLNCTGEIETRHAAMQEVAEITEDNTWSIPQKP